MVFGSVVLRRLESWPAAVRDDCTMPERRAVGAVTGSLNQIA